MGDVIQKPAGDKRSEIRARRVVSDRLRRFYGNLLSGLQADADDFFRRVVEQRDTRERGSTGSPR